MDIQTHRGQGKGGGAVVGGCQDSREEDREEGRGDGKEVGGDSEDCEGAKVGGKETGTKGKREAERKELCCRVA